MGKRPTRPLSRAISAAGLDRREVAAALGVSVSMVDAIAAGNAAMPEKHVGQLASMTGLEADAVRAMGRRPRPLRARSMIREAGYTYGELQALLGVRHYALVSSLNGQRPMTARMASGLADLLGAPVELLTAPEWADGEAAE